MSTPAEVGDLPPRSRRKRAEIAAAATDLFLSDGFAGTSMDAVAAYAGVSKRTVYAHYRDKPTLFTQVVTEAVRAVSDPVYAEITALRETEDLPADLRDLARRQLRLVVQPRIMELRRLVIGEAARFPELAKAFHELGPARTIEALADTFAVLSGRGLVECDDPRVAATHFNWLVMAAPLNRAMFGVGACTPDATELDRCADEGVRAFLAAYGVHPPVPAPASRRRA